jgi:hypothetical protein
MYEYLVATVIRRDKTKALIVFPVCYSSLKAHTCSRMVLVEPNEAVEKPDSEHPVRPRAELFQSRPSL